MSLFPDLTATFINDGLSGLSYTLRLRSPWTFLINEKPVLFHVESVFEEGGRLFANTNKGPYSLPDFLRYCYFLTGMSDSGIDELVDELYAPYSRLLDAVDEASSEITELTTHLTHVSPLKNLSSIRNHGLLMKYAKGSPIFDERIWFCGEFKMFGSVKDANLVSSFYNEPSMLVVLHRPEDVVTNYALMMEECGDMEFIGRSPWWIEKSLDFFVTRNDVGPDKFLHIYNRKGKDLLRQR